MTYAVLALLLIAAACFILHAMNRPAGAPGNRVLGLGLFSWVLAQLLPVLVLVRVLSVWVLVVSFLGCCNRPIFDKDGHAKYVVVLPKVNPYVRSPLHDCSEESTREDRREGLPISGTNLP